MLILTSPLLLLSFSCLSDARPASNSADADLAALMEAIESIYGNAGLPLTAGPVLPVGGGHTFMPVATLSSPDDEEGPTATPEPLTGYDQSPMYEEPIMPLHKRLAALAAGAASPTGNLYPRATGSWTALNESRLFNSSGFYNVSGAYYNTSGVYYNESGAYGTGLRPRALETGSSGLFPRGHAYPTASGLFPRGNSTGYSPSASGIIPRGLNNSGGASPSGSGLFGKRNPHAGTAAYYALATGEVEANKRRDLDVDEMEEPKEKRDVADQKRAVKMAERKRVLDE